MALVRPNEENVRMSRAERLLQLTQVLYRHRRPVSGAVLAETLGVSLRTLYRDIASLQAQGAFIEGEPGVGYVLHPGYLLPPLMFSRTELEALVLGMRWVASRTDAELASDARQALGKIAAVLPKELRRELDTQSLMVPPQATTGRDYLPVLRQAIREERKLAIDYQDLRGQRSQRVIWPFALGFFERERIVAAWCEARQDLRHFRVDRLQSVELLSDGYPKGRASLLAQWRGQGGEKLPSG